MHVETKIIGEFLQWLMGASMFAGIILAIVSRKRTALLMAVVMIASTIGVVVISIEWNDRPYVAVLTTIACMTVLLTLMHVCEVITLTPRAREFLSKRGLVDDESM